MSLHWRFANEGLGLHWRFANEGLGVQAALKECQLTKELAQGTVQTQFGAMY